MNHQIPARQNNVLLLCENSIEHEPISRLFVTSGFPITVANNPDALEELSQFGAIVHVSNSSRSLKDWLGERLEHVREQEWVLIEGDDESDTHCTVELTVNSTDKLKKFVQTLWGRFNIA